MVKFYFKKMKKIWESKVCVSCGGVLGLVSIAFQEYIILLKYFYTEEQYKIKVKCFCLDFLRQQDKNFLTLSQRKKKKSGKILCSQLFFNVY